MEIMKSFRKMDILKFFLTDRHTEILSEILTYYNPVGQIDIVKSFLTEDILYFITPPGYSCVSLSSQIESFPAAIQILTEAFLLLFSRI